MRQFIETLFTKEIYPEYVECFYASDFQKKFDAKSAILVGEIAKLYLENQPEAWRNADRKIAFFLQTMTEYHVIANAKDINPYSLPENILRHQKALSSKTDLRSLIMDYLDFPKDTLKVYEDLIKMPVVKLKNASQHFVSPEKGEFIYFICDLSIFGNGKEGFAMTNFALYWKPQLDKAHKVYYHDLGVVKRKDEWISINNLFFNANPQMNTKMLLLLLKLKDIVLS